MTRRTQSGGNGSLIAPEVFEPVRRQLGVPDRVLDVLVAEPCLQRPRIVPGIGQGVAAGVPQHVREDREGHPGAPAEALEQRAEALGRHWAAALAGEHVWRCLLLTLQAPQGANFVALHKEHPGAPAEALEQRAEALGRHWAAALAGEHVWRCLLLTLQAPQGANFVALH